jgi:hypothetical protein
MQSLPLCPPCGRTPFSGRSLRVVDFTSTARFIAITDITNQMIKECPALGEIRSLDATIYLAEYAGMPGLVKGVCTWGHGMTVYSENLKRFTQLCPSRVSGNKIKFGYGSEEIKEERSDCWEFCVKRERVQVITPIQKQGAVEFPFTLTRPDDKTCPICFDELSGNVVCCSVGHQTCLKCFNLLPTIAHGQTIKKCVLCNKPGYTIDEYRKVEQMNGAEQEFPAYLQINLNGGNSFKEFCHNEALFLGMLKYVCNSGEMDIFRRMLMSALYNYYMNHPDRFSTYNFNLMHQTSGNIRTYRPESDDLTTVIENFLETVHTSQIFNDVAYTDFYLQGYDEIEFNRDIEAIEGENTWNRLKEYPDNRKRILMREIYFRTKINRSSPSELKEYIKNILYRITTQSSRFGVMFEKVKLQLPPVIPE